MSSIHHKDKHPLDAIASGVWAFVLLCIVIVGVLMLARCNPSRCTSHPYDPKAACADPRATLGPVDGGP